MSDYEGVRKYIDRMLDVAVRGGYGSDQNVRARLREYVRDEFRNEDSAMTEAEARPIHGRAARVRKD